MQETQHSTTEQTNLHPTSSTFMGLVGPQLNLFLTAIMFYTRIPCPKWVDHRAEYLNRATVYLPIVGWLVGGTCALVFWLSSFLFPATLSILLSMISGILLTGAFHEDGFGDVCDGFGGGWTKQRILEIMKDSRVGAYGVIGIVLMLAVKFFGLNAINPLIIPFVIIISHSLSRATALSFIYTHEYSRENEDSKAKPVAQKLPLISFLLAIFWGLFPLLIFCWWQNEWLYSLVIIPLILLHYFLGRYFQKWIGGYTGDCLGATQQLAEVIIYMFFASTLWTSI
ncbi:adenosylcobinamide-GDP ribazoletransferase [Solitalea sp. MAHUQ-68]|uniref:Adenosylcobinamide-GDP ribazoletransferase n=1 Tax=Solitalea agri TaxID=2953739 RepID=A0A9X2JD73_9SPHI|nr:adenosylcobinamide-GDP ribazoletransferase [Solitalea agri]MCO4293828.1 adenosylcobinamide-GDP ribazoletransferase [Solitalea agri]